MITDKKIFAVKCDNCGKICGAESDYDWWLTKEDAIKSMEGTYWRAEGDKHYCPECWDYDDEDNLIIRKERKNEGT